MEFPFFIPKNAKTIIQSFHENNIVLANVGQFLQEVEQPLHSDDIFVILSFFSNVSTKPRAVSSSIWK